MKKIKIKMAVLAAVLSIATFVSGCAAGSSGSGTSSFVRVEDTDNYVVYQHRETGVYYFCIRQIGGCCVMMNEDGTPYTGEYTEDKRSE